MPQMIRRHRPFHSIFTQHPQIKHTNPSIRNNNINPTLSFSECIRRRLRALDTSQIQLMKLDITNPTVIPKLIYSFLNTEETLLTITRCYMYIATFTGQIDCGPKTDTGCTSAIKRSVPKYGENGLQGGRTLSQWPPCLSDPQGIQ